MLIFNYNNHDKSELVVTIFFCLIFVVVDMNALADLPSSQTSNRSTNSTSVVDVYEMTAYPRG
jgi:hypothetical protein